MSEFSNRAVDLDDIPDFRLVELQPVHPKFRRVLTIRYTIALVITAFVLSLSVYYIPLPIWLEAIVIFVAFIIFLLVYLEFFLGFPNRKFGIREMDIIYQRGYLVKKETVVPFKRIQHVEKTQGLLMRKFKLYSLLIYTAGESSGDLKIAGLDFEMAQKIKSKVLQEIEDE